ncbi:glutamate--tRNA ligase [Horticoccus luteus]|uniref:Glutamate--tRNA ligase n=1 Tax=Horticoccus luteus TaxID=2862869 RepID=A0A8F9TYS9_9BACT|nr:glutamate--tRNA ligase family protein [Horticoccus luteus]QYM80359.1 glutamate--tRNA ligase [Horticoccus luteus]
MPSHNPSSPAGSKVRVRFAPSPTGFFHIGSARTALFNWLYARHTGGTFILRIEDTDKERNSEPFLNVIYDSLNWLGLRWDEGPQVGGDFGPYRQSERTAIYQQSVERLFAAGRAYEKDGAVWFKLLGERREVFDDHRKKTVTKVATPPVVIEDRIRGRVERVEDEDFVIVRSDGNPVFHLVNVVDDIAMNITHVIRGEDHLSNTSKHVHLFEAFGAAPPVFAHIPLILKQNGPGKMSKRDQGALVEEYQRRGYLPEALVNFLSLLGWNPGDDREKMPLEEIVRLFDLKDVNQSNARFDDKKLAHMNMVYLLEQPAERFVALARTYFERLSDNASAKAALSAAPDYFREVMMVSQPKVKGLEELPAYTVYFFQDDFPIDPKVREKVLGKGDPRARLSELFAAAAEMDFGSDAAIEEAIKQLATQRGLGFGDYQAVARLAVTGTNAGPSITGIFRILGRQRVHDRLTRFAQTIV